MIRSIWKRIVLFALVLLMIPAFPVTASAAEFDINRTGTIQIQLRDTYFPENTIEGTLVLYKVGDAAEIDSNLSFVPASQFSGSGADLNDLDSPELAPQLAAYAAEHTLTGISASADKDGNVTFSGLSTGLYLVVQTEAAEGYLPVSPFLVSLPMYHAESGGWLYTIEAAPKVQRPPKEPVTLTVVKKWRDNNKNRPESLPVNLLKEGEPVDTVILTAEDGWKYTWTDLNAYYQWSVEEVVPEGYKASYSTYGRTVTITNKADWYIPPADQLIQTGQLNWPVPVLLCAGLSMLLIGCVLLRRRKQDA